MHLLFFIKLERVPWFGSAKIGMVWGPRGVASPVPIVLLRLINCRLHSLVAVVVSNPAAAQAVMLAAKTREKL